MIQNPVSAVGFVSRARVKMELLLPGSDLVSALLTILPRAFLLPLSSPLAVSDRILQYVLGWPQTRRASPSPTLPHLAEQLILGKWMKSRLPEIPSGMFLIPAPLYSFRDGVPQAHLIHQRELHFLFLVSQISYHLKAYCDSVSGVTVATLTWQLSVPGCSPL